MSPRPGSGKQAWKRRNAGTERSVDQALADAAAARRAENAPRAERARKLAEQIAAMPAVDRADLVVGHRAIDRSRSVGRIVRLNRTTATLRSDDGLEWRTPYADIIRTKGPDA